MAISEHGTDQKPFRLATIDGRSVAVAELPAVEQAAEALSVVEGVLLRCLNLMRHGKVELAQQGIQHVRQMVSRWGAEAGELAEQLGKAWGQRQHELR